jgi:hypothetical protein
MFPSGGKKAILAICSMVAGGLLGLTVLAAPAFAADGVTLSSSNNNNNDMSAFRGFDPTVLTGPADPHPDTTLPSADFMNGSTEFGFGLVDGASDRTVCMNRTDCNFNTNDGGFPEGGALTIADKPNPADQAGNGYYYLSYVESGDDGSGGALLKQGLQNDALSGAVNPGTDCRTVTAIAGQKRCNELDFGFHQENAMVGTGSAAGGHGDGDQVFDMFFSVDALVDSNGELLGEAKGTYTQAYTDVTNGVTTSNSCTGAFTYSTASGYTQTSGTPGECP